MKPSHLMMLFIQKASIVVFKEARSAEGPKHFDFLKWSEGGQRPTERSVFKFFLLCTSARWSPGVGHRRVMARHAAPLSPSCSGTESVRFLCYVRALARATSDMASWLNKRVLMATVITVAV